MKAIILYCLLIVVGIMAVNWAKPGYYEFMSTKGVAADTLRQIAEIGGGK